MFRSLLSQKYLPIRRLAEGGSGEIHLARQVGQSGFQREVVLRRIHHRPGEDPRAVESFLDEARLAATLSHPSVVQIYDVGEEDGAYLIAMERVHGPSLRELAETTNRRGLMIPMELSLTIVGQVLEGLRYAHGLRDESGRPVRVVHRDICPSNILVSEDGVAKIADFGRARSYGELRDEGAPPPGKLAYLSPEAVRGEAVDARADLFSVGVVLYELTVGQRLFRAGSFEELQRVVAEPIPPPTFARAGYPVDLELLVMRALERNADDRFASAEEMLEAVEQFAFDNGLRLSRLRLARFVNRVLGGAKRSAQAEERSDPAAEDLDFDQRGIFEGQGRTAAAQPEPEREQARERSRDVREAVKQANEAIAELVGDSQPEPDRERTREMRVSEQSELRARSREAELEAAPDPSARRWLRDGSAVVVTDELVEEETDLGDPGEGLLREPALAAGMGGQELDPEDLPTGVATPAAERATPAQGPAPAPTAEPEPGPGPGPAGEPVQVSSRARTGSAPGEPASASADLIAALADISAELRAAAESDHRREVALVRAVDSSGGAEVVPMVRLEPPRPAAAPPPAAVPPPPAALPAPLLLQGAIEAPSGPLTAIARVRDELEAADGATRRSPDDLELSDLSRKTAGPKTGEEPELEADGEPIVLGVEDASFVGEVRRRAMPPAPPAATPASPAPPAATPEAPPLAAPDRVAAPPAVASSGEAVVGTARPEPEAGQEPEAGKQPAGSDGDGDDLLDAPTLVDADQQPAPATGGAGRGKRRKRGKRRRSPASSS